MADDLTDEEREILKAHRAKNKPVRKVRVYGKDDKGAEYEFELDGDEADGVIKRHAHLWKSDDPADGQAGPADDKPGDVKRFGRRVG